MSEVPTAEALRRELARRLGPPPPALEDLLTSPEYFNLVTASPLQRAVCRIIDGKALLDLAKVPEVIRAVGGTIANLPRSRPDEVCILSGIRAAKSMIAAALSIQASQICDVSQLGPGEIPRFSVVSIRTDLAKVIFDHLVGNLMARPKLKALLLEEPAGDAVMLRHPSGRPIEVKIVAGARAGASLVARWSAGCVFDEAPRMVGSDDGVVNYDDCRAAVLGRLLPKAQVVSIGSPWAPFGPIYELVQEHFGKPSSSIVVIRAPAWDMNPVWWTPERREKFRRDHPDTYRTDGEAEFADPETSLLNSIDLGRCTRQPPKPTTLTRRWGHQYVAAMDPATRGNAWTLVIATRDRDGKLIVVLAMQWIGTKVQPLSPRAVLKEIAGILREYELESVMTDQWAGDALRDIAADKEIGISLHLSIADEKKKLNRYNSLATRIADAQVELPPDPVVRSDLLAVKKRITQTGAQIVLPKTADGRHCDYAPAITLALSMYLDEAAEVSKPDKESWAQQEAEREEVEDEREILRKEKSTDFWQDDW